MLDQKLTTQLVRPESAYLLIYPGGFGGEFMAYWLSQHPGCIPSIVRQLKNNRYVHILNNTFEFSPKGTDRKLFLITHPYCQLNLQSDNRSFSGIVFDDPAQKAFITCADHHKKFFFVLMWLKMRLFRFTVERYLSSAPESGWAQHLSSQFGQDHDTVENFKHYINGREWFYQFEFDSWRNGTKNIPVINRIHNEYQHWFLPLDYHSLFNIDLSELMFGDSETEHQRLCQHFGIDYESSQHLDIMMQQYHQRNIDLAERYLKMPIDDFVALSNDQAQPVIQQALLRCDSEPWIPSV